MSATPLNPIWGTALRPEVALETAARGFATMPSIKRQLRTFLVDQIECFRPDRIVVVERKGTAILRALMDWKLDPLPWLWSNVISSSSVSQASNDYFAGKRILIFDDMMRSGKHLCSVLAHLEHRGIWDLAANNVRVAVFAVHEESSNAHLSNGDALPHAWFYRDLPNAAYREIRTDVVRMLQGAGSLMLDTEHVEVRVRVGNDMSRFLDVLRRRARAVLFHSSAYRTNITVYYPDDEAHRLPAELLPPRTAPLCIVKKCRIVQREGNEFAIIPICYPSIPADSSGDHTAVSGGALFDFETLRDGEARFYATGLVAALHVLGWALRDLATATEAETYTISLPSTGKAGADSYTLDHLRVMYPTLDIARVADRIATIDNDARREGKLLRTRKSAPSLDTRFDDDELRANALDLLQAIRYLLDEDILEALRLDHSPPAHPHGLTAKDIFTLARDRFGWEDIRTSVLFDILIDEAALVPHVETRERTDGEGTWLVRTFEPDGEMVSELVRRLTVQWGLPHGL